MSAAATRRRRAGRLPPEPTSFVGRRDELNLLQGLLTKTPLVTLTGAGGVGKSRLAVRAAARVRGSFPGGAWLIELSSLRDPESLAGAVAQGLGMPQQTVRPELEAIADRMGAEPTLLLLDTCEHLLSACAQTVCDLQQAVPALTVLATSRQPLGVPGEQVLVVEPMPLDQRGDAVALFAARAAEAVPGFTLTDANVPDVLSLCRRLDGIPLALELAAVQLRELPLPELLELLVDRFGALAGDLQPGPVRHRTLRTAIGWSHELCVPLERLLWARLAVFAGGWDRAAAEHVCPGGPLPREWVADLLDRLVEKSIVLREERGGRARYRMLDTIRDFGAEWLAGLGEEGVVRERHRDYFRSLAERAEAEWLGPGQRAWAQRVIEEYADIRTALEHCLAEADPRPAQKLAGTLWFFWHACGFADEGRRYLQRALDRDPTPCPERALADWAHRLVAISRPDLDAAEEVSAGYGRMVAARGLPDAAALLPLSAASLAVRGESARSATLARHGADGPVSGVGAEFFRLLTLAVRAYLRAVQGEFRPAAEAAWQLREECAKRGELWMRAWGDFFLGLAQLGRGDARAAADSARAALAAKWQLHDVLGAAAAVDLVTAAVLASGARTATGYAARLLGAGSSLWRAAGLPQLGSAADTGFRRACELRLRVALGDAGFDMEFRAGSDLGKDEAVQLAAGPGPE